MYYKRRRFGYARRRTYRGYGRRRYYRRRRW